MFAYRCFRVRRGELRSVYTPFEWDLGVNQAECVLDLGGSRLPSGQCGPCEAPPNRSHVQGCGLYGRIDLEQPGWLDRCNLITTRPIWPFPTDQLALGLVWAGGRIIEHHDDVIRAETMKVLLAVGWADVNPWWQDHYVKLPQKHWALEAEKTIRAQLEAWLSSAPG
ncbi:MAG TPA: hypothetical protein VFY10_14655 [Dehalococcoidia bacterium]|nr:hypothetical protein [Dehalococcoidia bacterium]